MKFLRAKRGAPCPVCRRADWCGISPGGEFAVCMRVQSGKTARNGGWIHRLVNTVSRPVESSKASNVRELIKPARRDWRDLHEIYSAFLGALPLSFIDQADLARRGLLPVSMATHGYKSMPARPFSDSICRALSGEFDLRHAPGFYFGGGAWHFVDYFGACGYLIPIRNFKREICALQLRRSGQDGRLPKYMLMSSADKPRGATSGAPAHFAISDANILPPAEIKSVIVTEGALKANVIAALSNSAVVGLVGTGSFDDSFPNSLKTAYPNLELAAVAFDMDALSNDAVKRQRERLVSILRNAKIKTQILTWNPNFKGLDDYLSDARRRNVIFENVKSAA